MDQDWISPIQRSESFHGVSVEICPQSCNSLDYIRTLRGNAISSKDDTRAQYDMDQIELLSHR